MITVAICTWVCLAGSYCISESMVCKNEVDLVSGFSSGLFHVNNRHLCCLNQVFVTMSSFSLHHSTNASPRSFLVPNP